jgi:hypothetical protein
LVCSTTIGTKVFIVYSSGSRIDARSFLLLNEAANPRPPAAFM